MQKPRKKFLDRFKNSAKLGADVEGKNETKIPAYKFQTLFMVVAGQSYGVACASATN